MKKLMLLMVMAGILICGTAFAEEKDLALQTVCPVMGGKINKNEYTDYQGQRIYFCCPACKPKFSEDPEKYMQKIVDNKVLLESVQEKCPVMGGKINKKLFEDYKGRRIYFCCEGCRPNFTKDPENYLKKLE